MKALLLLLLALISLSANEQRLLLSGFTIHEKPNNRFGDPYNYFNYGIGYEYNLYEEPESFYWGLNTIILSDSYRNPQLTTGLAYAIRYEYKKVQTAVGLAGFIGIKKRYTDEDTEYDQGHYTVIGGVAPMLNFYYKDVSLNFLYVPHFHYKEIDITGFLYTYFSWKF